MLNIVLIFLALTGLQAVPISRRLTKTHNSLPLGVKDVLPVALPEDFKQGTEPSRRFIVDLNTGLVQDYISEMNRRTSESFSSPLGNGHGEMDRKHWLTDDTAEEVPVQKNGGGWVRVEGHATIPDGFRQGTEPSLGIAAGFRQGTEPAMPIRDGYRQGTERFMPIPDGFRQGTEPSVRIRDGFRQGTEPSLGVQKGFRQGTEHFLPIPDGFRQGTEPSVRIRDGFRQGTEPSLGVQKGFRQGTEPSFSIVAGFRQGTEPSNPISYREVALSLNAKQVNTIPDGFKQGTEPSLGIAPGFRQVTESAMPIRDGFRQGTERFMPIPDGFRQGTEPSVRIRDGFRQGTEPSLGVQKGFRQGTEPFLPIPNGFRQGTEPSFSIAAGFRQGTEPTNLHDHREGILSLNAKQVNTIPNGLRQEGFRPGTGPFMPVRDGDQHDTQPSNYIHANFRHVIDTLKSRQESNRARCNGEIINRRCYAFNPKPMPFLEAQDSCKSLHPNAELAAVTSKDLHSRLVSIVTNGGQRDQVMTWLGGIVKNQRASWLDRSQWKYSDWMPGQPTIHGNKPVCVEMFRMDETWWTAADCELKRASICSYPVAA